MIKNRPFGIVKDNMIVEVESYINDLLSRASKFIQSINTDPEILYNQYMQQRNLPAALASKAVYVEQLRAEADGKPIEANRIDRRLVIIGQMIKDDVDELVQNTDFSFLESMKGDIIRKELTSAYQEHDIPSIVFYVCAYSLHSQMKRISGID
jgi:hypothetical protein